MRNAAYAAMDLATLARIFPGRLHVGFGHGVADWIRQVGQMPASQMAALEEITVAVRDILHGQTVTMSASTSISITSASITRRPSSRRYRSA